MSNKLFYFLLLLAFVALIGGLAYLGRPIPAPPGMDDFAKCLSSKGAVMYGAAWCSHCQNQKKEFGSAFRYVNYVECPAKPDVCLAKGVSSFPTWEINGNKFVGEQSLDELASKVGCALVKTAE